MTTSKTDLESSIEKHDEQIDKTATQEGQNTKDYVRKVLTNTSFKYLGISFLLTYRFRNKERNTPLRQQEPFIRHPYRLGALFNHPAIHAGLFSDQFIDICSCLRRRRT